MENTKKNEFKVGDEVICIVPNEFFTGFIGVVKNITNNRIRVEYCCEESKKKWNEGLRTYDERPDYIRKLTKLERALK